MSVVSAEELRASLVDHFPQGSQYDELESVGEAYLSCGEDRDLVAHVTATYARPFR